MLNERSLAFEVHRHAREKQRLTTALKERTFCNYIIDSGDGPKRSASKARKLQGTRILLAWL